jgi:hypothetical protein
LGQKDERYVVVPLNAAQKIPFRLFDASVQLGTWQPSQLDIDALEANLPQLSALSPSGWKPVRHIEHPEQYYRQYIGVTVHSNNLIYVNAFCDNPPPPTWKTQLYIVIDGGTCYWQAFYDPAAKKFSNLMIDGRA